ncbi:MAG: tRNA lysidine(34) synthetase TilS, partial [Gammaproteobacteria bacterium]
QVNAFAGKRESPEEAARNARYSALKELIGQEDILLVGHHREDQLETVLFQLLRGSGLRGLSGMPKQSAFGKGILLRPLLNISKQEITDYAHIHGLNWVEDPSNLSNHYNRNFLRNEVIPLLKRRWPACDATIARSASHCADADALIVELTQEIFSRVYDPGDNTLSVSRLAAFDRARKQLIIRHWFGTMGLKMPSQDFVTRLLAEAEGADKKGNPEWLNQGYAIRRYRDKLYILKQSWPGFQVDRLWPTEQKSVKIGQGRVLTTITASEGIDLERWRRSKRMIKFRQGGEKIRLPARQGSHSAKKLFQEAGIPPWEREKMPFVYLDEKLAAIGDRWISADFLSRKKEACILFSVIPLGDAQKDNDEIPFVD